jgi:hypothetical protein
MNASKGRVFYYHANASPIGGFFTHPVEQVIPSHGSSSLAQAGGNAAARVSGYRLDSLVSFDHAYSEIYGTANKTTGSWTTTVTSVVEGLNVVETVTADRVVAVLTIEHPTDGGFPKASVVGSQFENLRIGGVQVTPVLGQSTVTPHEAGKFPATAAVDDKEFVSRAVGQYERLTQATGSPDWLQKRYEWMGSPETRKSKGYLLSSLVDKFEGTKAEHTFGHVMHVPDFGNIFLSELLTDHHTFRLTMIRMEMGCANHGTISIGGGDGNGSTMP